MEFWTHLGLVSSYFVSLRILDKVIDTFRFYQSQALQDAWFNFAFVDLGPRGYSMPWTKMEPRSNSQHLNTCSLCLRRAVLPSSYWCRIVNRMLCHTLFLQISMLPESVGQWICKELSSCLGYIMLYVSLVSVIKVIIDARERQADGRRVHWLCLWYWSEWITKEASQRLGWKRKVETSYTLWFCFAYWSFCIRWIKMAILEVLEDAAPECIRFAIFWLGFVEGMVEMLYAVEKGRRGAWNSLVVKNHWLNIFRKKTKFLPKSQSMSKDDTLWSAACPLFT